MVQENSNPTNWDIIHTFLQERFPHTRWDKPYESLIMMDIHPWWVMFIPKPEDQYPLRIQYCILYWRGNDGEWFDLDMMQPGSFEILAEAMEKNGAY